MRAIGAAALAGRTAEVDRLLDGLPPALRGHACAMGVVLQGARALAAWKDAAKRLLFVHERPFLG